MHILKHFSFLFQICPTNSITRFESFNILSTFFSATSLRQVAFKSTFFHDFPRAEHFRSAALFSRHNFPEFCMKYVFWVLTGFAQFCFSEFLNAIENLTLELNEPDSKLSTTVSLLGGISAENHSPSYEKSCSRFIPLKKRLLCSLADISKLLLQ